MQSSTVGCGKGWTVASELDAPDGEQGGSSSPLPLSTPTFHHPPSPEEITMSVSSVPGLPSFALFIPLLTSNPPCRPALAPSAQKLDPPRPPTLTHRHALPCHPPHPSHPAASFSPSLPTSSARFWALCSLLPTVRLAQPSSAQAQSSMSSVCVCSSGTSASPRWLRGRPCLVLEDISRLSSRVGRVMGGG